MSKDLSIGVLDVSNVDKDTFDIFMNNYKQVLNNLCVNPKTKKRTQNIFQRFLNNLRVNPKTKERTQNIFQLIPEKYDCARKICSSYNYKIRYLYKNNYNKKDNYNKDYYEIVAFAITSTNPDSSTTILEMICSSKDKSIRRNGIRLGIYLLDDIYSDYVVNQGNILKIQPATPELVPYYTEWKEPSLPIDWYYQGKTYGYLIYSLDIKQATDEQLAGLISDFKEFDLIRRELHITPSEILTLSIKNKEDRKKSLTLKIKKSNHSSKDQLLNRLSSIDYFSVDEIRSKLTHKGGKKHRRKTKHNHNRRQKRTRKTKYV
jgi:hypothetical protein